MRKVVSVTQQPTRKPYRRGEGGKLRADILAAAALIEETGSEQSVGRPSPLSMPGSFGI